MTEFTTNSNFNMKITTMRRPDGKNQYKITLPKFVVEMCQKQKVVVVGKIFIGRDSVALELKEILQEGE